MSLPARLPAEWRTRADELEPFAAPAAVAFRRAADELESALREAADTELTLTEAARESGYSDRRLRELIADGSIPQAGRKHAPRLRRGDLPKKAKAKDAGAGYDARADAAALLRAM
jgi:hypothetical protein